MKKNGEIRIANLAGVGCITTSSTLSEGYSTSTRFNNSERFSLEQLKNNKKKLKTIKNLRQNWNGYESREIDDSLISLVENIISGLDYQPQLFPTGRGSIQIEKYINEDNLIEIEVTKNHIFAYCVKDGKEIEREISVDEINSLISDLYASGV